MYSKFYSPNIIAVGSSKLDQSSYSHHADSDVGVAVIDRFTYYNLEFLETQIHDQSSKMTLGNLFDSYDEGLIHSSPGFRYDLLPGGEKAGRDRLVMDFFGNVQNIDVGREGQTTDSSWEDDMAALQKLILALKSSNETSTLLHIQEPEAVADPLRGHDPALLRSPTAFDVSETLKKQAAGLIILLGGLFCWFAGSILTKVH